MTNTASFKKDLARFGNKLERVLVEIQKETGKDIRFRVASKTPILTGRASGSWNAQNGTPNLSTKPLTYNNPNGAPLDGEVNLESTQLGEPIFISNSVGYIESLNAGSRTKAPAGFIEAIVLETEQALQA